MPTQKQVFCYFWIKVIDEAAQILDDAQRLARPAGMSSGSTRSGNPVVVNPVTNDGSGGPVVVNPVTNDRNDNPVVVNPVTNDRPPGGPVVVNPVTNDRPGNPVVVNPVTNDRPPGGPVVVNPTTNDRSGSPVVVNPVTNDRNGGPVVVNPVTNDRDGSPVVVNPVTNDRNPGTVVVNPVTNDYGSGAITQWTQNTTGSTSITISTVPQGYVVADASAAYTTDYIALNQSYNEDSARAWIETDDGKRWRGNAKVCVLHHVVVTITS
jgi:hypothetical protein